MNISPRSSIRWIALLAMLALRGVALEEVRDGPAARRETMLGIQKLFLAGDFVQLDKKADILRREKTRTTEGLWQLGLLYAGLTSEGDKQERQQARPAVLTLFARWEKSVPSSITARVAHALTLVYHAWDARGDGYADTVSEEGGRLFEERLGTARALLESDAALKACPVYYSTMMTIARGQGWSRAETERLFQEGQRIAPDFELLYFSYATYLQEKWYGRSPDEWLQFAIMAAESTKQALGMTLYTRLVWGNLGPRRVKPETFDKAGIEWPRMRQGFEDILKQYPGSQWNQNAYCYYAYAAGDRETAKRLFAELDGHYAKEIWGSPFNFQHAWTWARQEAKRGAN